jgi:hypothetical protein
MGARLFVNGDVSMNSRLFVNSDVSLGSRLFVSRDSYITGNVYTTSLFTTSDYRIKQNVTSLTNIHVVDNLNPVEYYNTIKNKKDFGLIAHELQEHYPFLVNGEKDQKNYQTVDYIGLIPILINEFKLIKQSMLLNDISLNNVITALQLKNSELENRIEELEYKN